MCRSRPPKVSRRLGRISPSSARGSAAVKTVDFPLAFSPARKSRPCGISTSWYPYSQHFVIIIPRLVGSAKQTHLAHFLIDIVQQAPRTFTARLIAPILTVSLTDAVEQFGHIFRRHMQASVYIR